MPYTVKIDLEGVPADEPVEISGLGLFKNGETAEVDDGRVKLFLELQQRDSLNDLHFREGISVTEGSKEEEPPAEEVETPPTETEMPPVEEPAAEVPEQAASPENEEKGDA